jgi:hypothetical protein
MPVVTQTRLQTSVFLAACDICRQPQPLISHRMLESRFGKQGKALLQKGGLQPTDNLRYVSAPQGDDDIEAEVVMLGEGKFGYWGDAGWVAVDPDDLRQYALDLPWFLRWVANGFQIPKRVNPREVLADHVWLIGDGKFGRQTIPIFFVRHLSSSDALKALRREIRSAYKGKTTIVLTPAVNDDIAELPRELTVISLPDVVEEAEFFKINTDRVQSLLGNISAADGFSDGYRTARFDGKDYTFTKKQAAILEDLHAAGKPLHKTEFMSRHSSQDDPKGVFRSGGKYHPAWDVFIKFDSQGNYWLAT